MTDPKRAAPPLDRSTPPPPRPVRPFTPPPVARFHLENGLPVLFSRSGDLPVSTFSLLLPGGGIRESPEEAGLATLTASLLESGTSDLEAGEIAEKMESLGATLHFGTSWEVSNLDFTSLVPRAAETAALAARLVRDPTFPAGEVERIRQEQLAGILQRRADPRGLANEMVSRYIYAPESPFSRPLGGSPSTVAALGREDVMAFHRIAFTPRSAGLIVAGNLSLDEVRRIAEVAFGDWAGDEPPHPPAPTRPRSDSRQVVIVSRPGSVQAEIRVGHVGVSRTTPDYFPIVVMNTILGGAFSSRLNLNLRERHGFTYGASSSFAMRRKPGPFLVSTAVQTEVTGAAVREILHELTVIREAPVAEDEIADARQYVAGTYPLRLETTHGVASRLAELFVYDLPDSYLDEFSSRVLAVSREEVLMAAERYVHPDRVAIVIVGDADAVRPQLEGLGFDDIQIVEASEER